MSIRGKGVESTTRNKASEMESRGRGYIKQGDEVYKAGGALAN